MNFLRKIWNGLHSKPEKEYFDYMSGHPFPQVILTIPESTKDGEKLTGREIERMRKFLPAALVCPDCCMNSLVDGPSGGGSQNVYCTYRECLSRFNDMGPFGWQRISDKMPAKKFAALARVMAAENTIKLEESKDDDNFELKGNL